MQWRGREAFGGGGDGVAEYDGEMATRAGPSMRVEKLMAARNRARKQHWPYRMYSLCVQPAGARECMCM